MYCVSSSQFNPLTVETNQCLCCRFFTNSSFVCSARILPEKLTVYTTLVGLLNARNYNFGGEFVEAMIRQLKETLKNNLYTEAVYLVRGYFRRISNNDYVLCFF